MREESVNRMGSKRRDDNGVDDEELAPDLKRQKLLREFSPSSSPPASENLGLPGFNYGDDDDEEDYNFKQNGSRYNGDDNDDEEDDEEHEDDAIHVKRSRDVEEKFAKEQVEHLDKNKQWSRALDGSDYLPGMVGLNNIKETDFVNVTIQSLMRVTPLRNFFLIPENYQHCRSPLVHRFGELTRKIWHARNFKGQGELEVVKEIHSKALIEKKENSDNQDAGAEGSSVIIETSRMPFLMLGLDLPPPPLFKDVMEKNIIPQVPLFNILKKFDGETITEVVRDALPCHSIASIFNSSYATIYKEQLFCGEKSHISELSCQESRTEGLHPLANA